MSFLFNHKIEEKFNKIINLNLVKAYIQGVGYLSAITIVLSIVNLILVKFTSDSIFNYFDIFAYFGLFYTIFITFEYAKNINEECDTDINKFELIVLCLSLYIFSFKILNLSKDYLGIKGVLFIIILIYIATSIYRKVKAININTFESIPMGVQSYFHEIIKLFITVSICIFLLFIVRNITFLNIKITITIFNAINSVLSSLFGMLLIVFLICLLWVNGLHGASSISGLISPFLMYNLYRNISGNNVVFAGELINSYIFLGGSGSTLGLAVIMSKFSKNQDLKELGKNSLVMSMFNTNEPLIFGIPIVQNKIMSIPFFLAPMASIIIVYFATKFGFVNPISVLTPWPTPIGIGAFIATGFDFRAIILSAVCSIASVIIYYPFFNFIDKQ